MRGRRSIIGISTAEKTGIQKSSSMRGSLKSCRFSPKYRRHGRSRRGWISNRAGRCQQLIKLFRTPQRRGHRWVRVRIIIKSSPNVKTNWRTKNLFHKAALPSTCQDQSKSAQAWTRFSNHNRSKTHTIPQTSSDKRPITQEARSVTTTLHQIYQEMKPGMIHRHPKTGRSNKTSNSKSLQAHQAQA